MRRFSSVCVIVALVAVQFGFAHAAVCRSLMPASESPSDHCAKMAAQAPSDCSGMAGCAELCRGKASDVPTAPGKENVASQMAAQPDVCVAQSVADRPVSLDAPLPLHDCWRWVASQSPPSPHAFILFHALLV